jgi:hypothetical protein
MDDYLFLNMKKLRIENPDSDSYHTLRYFLWRKLYGNYVIDHRKRIKF